MAVLPEDRMNVGRNWAFAEVEAQKCYDYAKDKGGELVGTMYTARDVWEIVNALGAIDCFVFGVFSGFLRTCFEKPETCALAAQNPNTTAAQIESKIYDMIDSLKYRPLPVQSSEAILMALSITTWSRVSFEWVFIPRPHTQRWPPDFSFFSTETLTHSSKGTQPAGQRTAWAILA
ncbi:TAP domain-containing protein [Colletotrichum tofieldiae]|nr:TAP domain-containing protein [Colletotrichum tofieldiae]